MSTNASLLFLNYQLWNQFVSDETQCMQLSRDEEIKFLSAKDKDLAAYLKVHPEMAHELMVPSGFKQRLIRRYERYMGAEKDLAIQNGAANKAHANYATFDSLLPGQPTVIANPQNEPLPTWRQINTHVCRNGVDTISGERMAPHFEYAKTGEMVRILMYGNMRIELTTNQWHLMWDHVVCQFLDSKDALDIEFRALHFAREEVLQIGEAHRDWNFHSGQQCEIILKQLEHRLRSAHVGRPNPCSECCPFRSNSSTIGPKPYYKKYLTKTEAASLVYDDRVKQNLPVEAIDYDCTMRVELLRRGHKLAEEGAHCSCASH